MQDFEVKKSHKKCWILFRSTYLPLVHSIETWCCTVLSTPDHEAFPYFFVFSFSGRESKLFTHCGFAIVIVLSNWTRIHNSVNYYGLTIIYASVSVDLSIYLVNDCQYEIHYSSFSGTILCSSLAEMHAIMYLHLSRKFALKVNKSFNCVIQLRTVKATLETFVISTPQFLFLTPQRPQRYFATI